MEITGHSENYNGHARIGGYFMTESHLLFYNFIFKHVYLFYKYSIYWVPYYKVQYKYNSRIYKYNSVDFIWLNDWKTLFRF